MRLKTDEAVEEAFAAIEKLTDADLNIDDESDEQGSKDAVYERALVLRRPFLDRPDAESWYNAIFEFGFS
jgi:hypothetical protein